MQYNPKMEGKYKPSIINNYTNNKSRHSITSFVQHKKK